MEGYKVIKDFSFAEKGDVFTKVEGIRRSIFEAYLREQRKI